MENLIDVNDYLDSVFKNAVTKFKDKQNPFGESSDIESEGFNSNFKDNDNNNNKDENTKVNINKNTENDDKSIKSEKKEDLINSRNSIDKNLIDDNNYSINSKDEKHARQISKDFVSDLMRKEYYEDTTNVVIKENKHIIKNKNLDNENFSNKDNEPEKENQNDNISISSFKNFKEEVENINNEDNNKHHNEEDKQLARNLSGNLVVSVLSKDYKKPNELNIPSEKETHKKSSDFNLKVDKILSHLFYGMKNSESPNYYFCYDDNPIDIKKLKQDNENLNLLKSALVNKKIKFMYQPIINRESNNVEYYECLLRVLDKNNKYVSVGPMIKDAETKGLINIIDLTVDLRKISLSMFPFLGNGIILVVGVSESGAYCRRKHTF